MCDACDWTDEDDAIAELDRKYPYAKEGTRKKYNGKFYQLRPTMKEVLIWIEVPLKGFV